MRWLVWLSGAFWLGACQSDTIAPFTGDCSGDPIRCKPQVGKVVGVGIAQDAGAQMQSPEAGPLGTLTGNVNVFSDDLIHSAIYPNPADIQADGATVALVNGSWDGSTPYQLTGVKSEVANWVSARPTTAGADELLTLTPVPTDSVSSQDLFVIRGTTLDAVFDVLTAKPLRNTAQAQLVVRFLDATTQQPLPGLTVAMAEAQAIAYATGNSWTDVPGAVTDNTGMVVFANVTVTGAQPGITIGGARTATASVRAVAGGVSLAAFLLQ